MRAVIINWHHEKARAYGGSSIVRAMAATCRRHNRASVVTDNGVAWYGVSNLMHIARPVERYGR